jgi:glycosyltransferase involved in cell wall biosynthesis
MANTGTEPLVSVIIPAYNQGPWLARAIGSALGQTYPHVEVIVVNDGSTSTVTRDTAARYEGRIVYIEKANGGVASARNVGLEAAKGELIALLDQDDAWLPHRLERGVPALLTNPGVGVVHSSYYLVDERGMRTDEVRLPPGRWKPLPKLLLEVQVSSCTTLFPRALAVEAGGFDPGLNGSDDWDLWLRLALAGHDFYCIGEPLAEYRVHSGMTSADDDMMVSTGFRVLDKFYAQPGLPAEAYAAKAMAYYNKHAWAVALRYGRGEFDRAGEHMREAARLHPKGLATGRFVQTLVNAAHEGSRPAAREVRRATAFVLGQMKVAGVAEGLRRKLQPRARLLVALNSGSGAASRATALLGALARYPSLLVDAEVWSVLGKRAGSFTRKLWARAGRAGQAS